MFPIKVIPLVDGIAPENPFLAQGVPEQNNNNNKKKISN